MRSTHINTTTRVILNLLRTLPSEELDGIVKNIMDDLAAKRFFAERKASVKKRTSLKIRQFDLKLSDTMFDRNYLYENTR